jgi:hypothetical protein
MRAEVVMRLDRIAVDGALCALIACELVIATGCARGETNEDRSTIGAAARDGADGGVEGNESSGEEGNAGDGDSEEDMGGGGAAAEPSFGDVYAILAASCGGGSNGCHITGMAAELAMPDEAAAHDALVGTPSRKCDGELLVAPGDAEQSLLVTVLLGGAECVKAMPLGRDPLEEEDVETIRRWIEAGAERD